MDNIKSTGTSPSSGTRSARLAIPPQHGAWAFLVVPLALGFTLVGWSAAGALFASAWVLAYPASYYLGRAVVVRWRRGVWSRLARRELRAAMPWIMVAAIASALLVWWRPWLVWVGLVLAAAWLVSVWLTRIGHERGASNDLLLVAQASLAVPILWAVTFDAPSLGLTGAGAPDAAAVPASVAWLAAFVCFVYFTGTVLHVKSLIREADDRRWARASRVYAIVSLSVLVISPWLLAPFGVAAVRAFAVPAGARPAMIGGVEIGVSVLLVVFGALALA